MAPGRVRAPPLAAARARQRIFSMSNILVINASGQETRVALIEHGIISEYYLERKNEKGIVGNIYKGKVVRVLPGMQAAFVDIGLDKAALLSVADIVSDPSSPGFSEELDEQAAAVLGDPLDSDDLPEPAEDAQQAGEGAETAAAAALAAGAAGGRCPRRLRGGRPLYRGRHRNRIHWAGGRASIAAGHELPVLRRAGGWRVRAGRARAARGRGARRRWAA